MNIKQWLNRARNIDREIDVLVQERDETRARVEKITQTYDSIGVQSTKDPHKFDRLVELETEIDREIDNLVAVKTEILQAINRLEDSRYRAVLRGRYIDSKTFEKIAVEMHYSYKQVCRLHGRALLKMEDVLECPIAPVV